MKRVIIAALAVVVMASFAKDEGSTAGLPSDIEATFANSKIDSRTVANSWEDSDEVGIFMYESGKSDATYALAKENVLHSSDATGKFTLDLSEEPIYYPQTDMVDFYAYYPYQSTMVGSTYVADITAQNTATGGFDQGAVDFMTASLTEKYKSNEVLTFDFTHRLAIMTLVLSPKTSIESIDGMFDDVEVVVSNINTKATFDALTGLYLDSGNAYGSIKLLTSDTTVEESGDVSKVTATAIVLPESLTAVAEVSITLGDGTPLKTSFSIGTQFEAGKNHTFNISVGYDDASFDDDEDGNTITSWSDNDLVSSDTIDAEEN